MPPPAASPMSPATSRPRLVEPTHVPTCRDTSPLADTRPQPTRPLCGAPGAPAVEWRARCLEAVWGGSTPRGGLGRLNARMRPPRSAHRGPSLCLSLGASASYLAIPCSSTLYPCSSTLSEAPTALCCSCWCPLPSSLQPHSPPQRRRVLCVACVSIAPLRKGASHGSTLQNIFRCPT